MMYACTHRHTTTYTYFITCMLSIFGEQLLVIHGGIDQDHPFELEDACPNFWWYVGIVQDHPFQLEAGRCYVLPEAGLGAWALCHFFIVMTTTMDECVERFYCPVCNEIMMDGVYLRRCGHNFCSSCISNWLLTRKENTCPVCRQANRFYVPATSFTKSPRTPKSADTHTHARTHTQEAIPTSSCHRY